MLLSFAILLQASLCSWVWGKRATERGKHPFGAGTATAFVAGGWRRLEQVARHSVSDFDPVKAFQLWVPLPPSCKVWFIKAKPARSRKVQNIVSATRGDHLSMLGTCCSHRSEGKPCHCQVRHRAAMARTSIRTTRLQPGQHFGQDLGRVCSLSLPSLQWGALVTAKLVTGPLPRCFSDPFKMTP